VVKLLTEALINHVYYESPGTAHEWQTWRRSFTSSRLSCSKIRKKFTFTISFKADQSANARLREMIRQSANFQQSVAAELSVSRCESRDET